MSLRIKAVIACDKLGCKVEQDHEIEISSEEVEARRFLSVAHRADALPEGWSYYSSYGASEVRCPEHTDPFCS